jgi:hypothetical protein
MSAEDALLFVDSNQYLDLYRRDKGKKLLAPLGEQAGYIFVTRQVVAEVERRKVTVAADFLNQKFRELALQTFNVPDHLSGTGTAHGKDIPPQMREIARGIGEVNEKVGALALGIMEQISRSEDEVSRALAPIFANAVPHSDEELRRARDRRELGNPPGKGTNPLGDQLIWEQILTHFGGKTKLWIISRDGDYGTIYRGKGFLNRFLLEELSKVTPAPEVYLFEDLVDGIEHFVRTTGVQAEQRLTPEEAREIKEEERALPRLAQPSEELGRAMTDVAKLAQPSEEMPPRWRPVDKRTRLLPPADRNACAQIGSPDCAQLRGNRAPADGEAHRRYAPPVRRHLRHLRTARSRSGRLESGGPDRR